MGASSHSGISSIFPVAIYVQGSEQQTLSLNHTPYTVGRKVDRDLVIADPRVSREHASIVAENGEFFVVDQGSKHGTFVNGERLTGTNYSAMTGWSLARAMLPILSFTRCIQHRTRRASF
jgi:pSer/pThr/pTyr-binding forkhead associated (FHA) protein